MKRHKWSAVIRYGIETGTKGFTRPNRKYSTPINVGDLNERIDQFIEDGFAKQANGKLEVDLGHAGYTKLLGDGAVDKPLRILVRECSERASEKISQAGGEVVQPQRQKEG